MNIKILLSCIFVFCLLQESHAQRAVTYTTTADRTKSLEKTVSATTTAAGSSNVITLNPGGTNQSIEGFGYAITYAAAYNLLEKMSKPQRTALLKKTFSPASGYGANYVRVSIGCCDFSSRDYTLCDEKGSDSDPLAKFALQSDETGYVIDTHTGVASAVYQQYKKNTGDETKTVIASTASFPTPSHIKIFSTMAVPPRRLPMDRASSVMIVSMEAFITLFQMITRLRIPLARAPVT